MAVAASVLTILLNNKLQTHSTNNSKGEGEGEVRTLVLELNKFCQLNKATLPDFLHDLRSDR